MKSKAIEIKQALKSGKPSIGSWMQIPDSSVAEIMGAAGYDWVAVDLEHGLFSKGLLPDIFRALELGGTVPVARVGLNEALGIKHALEAGARGVIVPMIESRAAMERAVESALYTPRGKRGVGFSRASLFGKNFEDHLQRCDDELILVAQIEDIRAVREIQEIAQTPGLDAMMVGPYDLSASMNLTGQFEHPDFLAAVGEIRAAARSAEVAMGMHVVQPVPKNLAASVADGNQWIAYATDAIFLHKNAERPAL
ncbi:MAG: aldolase/citrate lyase family protein [bacterium]|nr:aldolase/citrate lyase family protein [bacterium]